MLNKQECIGKAVAKNIVCSPYKLRPLANVVRGKSVLYAVDWLESIYRNKKAVPLRKVILSAAANLLRKKDIDIKSVGRDELKGLVFLELKVDQGPIRKYFNPGAQGKAIVLRTRYSHISVLLGYKSELKKCEEISVQSGKESGCGSEG